MHKFSVLFLLLFVCHFGQAQDFQDIKTIHIRCLEDSIHFQLPSTYRENHFRFAGGDYYDFNKKDSTLFSIYCTQKTREIHLSGEQYIVTDSIQNERKGIEKSQLHYWREINMGQVNIFYKHAKKEDQVYLDRVIDMIREKLAKE